MKNLSLALFFAFACALPAFAQEPTYTGPLGSALETEAYPVAPKFIEIEVAGEPVRMAYMDAAQGLTGSLTQFSARAIPLPVVVLLHGKNFSGQYFDGPMRALATAGFRVIVPDQIGFGKSGKPDIPYSFDFLADNTRKLLDALKIEKAAIVGHSMGGMLAVHFAAKYPERVTKLILENPIGLEDYRPAIGSPPLKEVFKNELADTDASKIRAFYKHYFVVWKPEYEKFVETKARQALSGEWPRVAKASALTFQMIVEQPVSGEFPQIQAPTLLIIGQEDRTVVGKPYAPPEKTQNLGNYPILGRQTAQKIPGAKLEEIPNVGHIPHLEAPDKFNAALLDFLKG